MYTLTVQIPNIAEKEEIKEFVTSHGCSLKSLTENFSEDNYLAIITSKNLDHILEIDTQCSQMNIIARKNYKQY